MQPPVSTPPDRLAWFAGNRDALDLYERLAYVAHAWDDLIDQDKPVAVNELMANLLLYLPSNRCYQQFQNELRALFMAGMVGYQAANLIEADGRDAHRLELAHYLRYAIMGAATFLIGVLNGVDKGAAILAEAAPHMIPERLADYIKEHSKC